MDKTILAQRSDSFFQHKQFVLFNFCSWKSGISEASFAILFWTIDFIGIIFLCKENLEPAVTSLYRQTTSVVVNRVWKQST